MPPIRQVNSATEWRAWSRFVAERYLSHGFLDPSECPGGYLRDRFDPHALHYLLCEEDERILGTFRIVLPSPDGLPIEEAFSGERLPETRDWMELTRVISRKKGGFLHPRNSDVSFSAICQAMVVADAWGKRGFLAMTDLVLFLHVNKTFDNLLRPIPGLTPLYFKGGWVLGVSMELEDFRKLRSRREDIQRHPTADIDSTPLLCPVV